MEVILTHDNKWPLVEISKEEGVQNLNNSLTFGYHKGTSAKLILLMKLIGKDVKHRFTILIPLNSVNQNLGLEMATMNIMAQNRINELRQVIPKDRLTHKQSWRWILIPRKWGHLVSRDFQIYVYIFFMLEDTGFGGLIGGNIKIAPPNRSARL